MKLSIESPLWLLCALPLAALTLLPLFLMRKKKRKKQKAAVLAARLLLCVMLPLALSGVYVQRVTKTNTVLLLADLSDSTRQVRTEMQNYIVSAQKYADKDTQIGLLTFGYSSDLELPLSSDFRFSGFQTSPRGNYTDLYSAVIRASALLPEGTNRRIVLLTDGKENIGSIREAAAVLSSHNIRLDAICLPTEPTSTEIQLSDIRVPDVIYDGEEFTITVTAESNTDCDAVLTLSQDGTQTSQASVHLSRGINRFVFREKAETPGITSYSVAISADGDWLTGNNRIHTFINVLGTPKILVVDGTGLEAHEFVKIIGDSALCETVGPAAVPTDIADLRKYSGVILMNTAKTDLPEDWDSLLEVYVRQLGRGLLCTGGNQSFLAGSWQDSVLESILPVNMTVKNEYELNDVGMMILIDNSGSMGQGPGSSLELAKSGAVKAMEVVKSIDKAGVIAFSDNAVWISDLVSGTQKKTIQNKIASIGPGGGTMLASALSEATDALIKGGTKIKSIILLTDGYPADEDRILNSNLIATMTENNIAITSICVGFESDPTLLKHLSDVTGGTLTSVTDPQRLPDIIYNESVKAMTGSYLRNETFFPEAGDPSALLHGVSALPALQGYILTEEKALADTVLYATEHKPLLSAWQYGLGKTAAFTSDLNGKWSSAFLAGENGQKLVRNMLSYILPVGQNSDGGTAEITRSGDRGILHLTTETADGSLETRATVISPSGKSTETVMTPDGVNSFTGSFLLEEEGSYVAIVTQTDAAGRTVLSKETAMAVRYSDEYNLFSVDDGSTAACCLACGGRGDWKNIGDILNIRLSGAGARTDLTDLLLVLSVLLLMTDIALRRLNLHPLAALKRLAESRKAARAADTAGAEAPAADTAAPASPSRAEADTSGAKQNARPEEKTEEYKPEKPVKKPRREKPAKTEEKKEDLSSDLASLMKNIDNSKRRKL